MILLHCLPTGSCAIKSNDQLLRSECSLTKWQVRKRIIDLQEHTRKKLHHAKARWSSAVELVIWSYALRQATYLCNCLPDKEDASSLLERFSDVTVSPKLKEDLSFGCPVYYLQNRLTGGGRVLKGQPRVCLVMNLGPSLRHAGSVFLMLNLQISMVFPPFHINHDDLFETVCPTFGNLPIFSILHSLSGLRSHEQPFRRLIEPAPQRDGHTKAVITWEDQLPPTPDRD